MQIIDGRQIARKIYGEIQIQVSKLSFQPVFCDILVGEDPASKQYVGMKARAAEKLGFRFRRANFPQTITTYKLIEEIKKINGEPGICGLIVQLPLPAHLDRRTVLNAIDAKIDVDCTGQKNTELFYNGNAYMEFPTAKAVMAIIESLGLDLSHKKFLVVGQGELVGKPVSFLLAKLGLDVFKADINTPNTDDLLKQSDVVISAVGKAKLITGLKIKPGAVIIDAGTSEQDGGIVGDVEYETVSQTAGYISPVPGGVGPVTVAMLLDNVLTVAKNME
jgi:methylenetetrahydrofolate dehydrogenase (NADP+) / methenyltetrahydrofolate cyclohydrolase